MVTGTPLYGYLNGYNHQYNQNLKHEEEEEEEEVPNFLLRLLPTKPKLSTKDLPWLVGNPTSQKSRFKFWLRAMDRASTLSCLLVNSFPGEDGQTDDDESSEIEIGPRIFQIGPLLASNNGTNLLLPTMWEEDKSCTDWLETQPPASVIYISFGSWVGPIGHEKIAELALGLEATKRPFLWVLKDDAAWRNGLPAGFIDRTAGRGKVVSWAPQEAVLAHRAVGCYVTHCGWNSTVEGVRHGKRLVCYPIAGDQFVNCNFIVRVWGIGIRPNGFGRGEIEDSIKRVMEGEEGEEIQERVLGLKEKVMGGKGRCRAWANLQLFVNEIKKAQ